jgi:hypothetical protein
MIKCGTIAAVVILGSAAGTATLVSDPAGTERAAAGGHSANEQTITARGTRSSLGDLDTLISSVDNRPRRGERSDYQPVSIATAESPDDGIRRGTR